MSIEKIRKHRIAIQILRCKSNIAFTIRVQLYDVTNFQILVSD